MPPSKFYDFDSIDADDDLEIELAKLYANYREETRNKSEMEVHHHLQTKVSSGKKEYHDVICGLLYGVLTEPENARLYFQLISLANRDQFALLISKLKDIILTIKFPKLNFATREQIFWLINELTSLNVETVEGLYINLMKQIRGGDLSSKNLALCDSIMKLLCERHKPWLDLNMKLIPVFVYTYLRNIADHRSKHQLQQREITHVIDLLTNKWLACTVIGRDLVRVLHDLSLTVPEFTRFWSILINSPQSLSPQFQGIEVLLKTSTRIEYLRSRLTLEIEDKLLWILNKLSSSQYQRNLNWFIQRYLSTAESEPFYVDIVRWLVAGWYPSNKILQSDIVPRYVVIGSMLRSIKNQTVLANVKTALIYDWLFFKKGDNIMYIEPAMLLMERSAERYPQITSSIMQFLKHSVDEYFPPLKDYMSKCVAYGMRDLLSKIVIRSLMPVYRCPATEPATKEYMQALFSEFLRDDPSANALSIPSMPANLQATPSIPSTPKTEGGYITEEEQEEGEYQTPQQSNQPHHISSTHNVVDDDEDEFLYGESDTNVKTPKTNEIEDEDEEMEDNYPSAVSGLMTEKEIDDFDSTTAAHLKDGSIATRSIIDGDDPNDVEQMATDDDYEDESDSGETIQQNQSYWIFGDSLKRFKEASAAAHTSHKERDETQYDAQLLIAKKSLKEIMDVFLRMAIPAETLVPTIGPYVRNMVAANMLGHVTTVAAAEAESDAEQDAVLNDPTKDLLDLIMTTFWNVRDNDAARDKLIRLIGCISHTRKSKGRRHIIGMRWWSFIAVQLQKEESMESSDADEWFPRILANYETYVMHAYAIEEATGDQSEYMRDYLKQDLHMLAEQSVSFFNDVIPYLYQYLPEATVGNVDILKLTVMMLMPDSMGRMVCNLHYGSMKIFGDKVDVIMVNDSLSLATYETMCFWQLLAAELQGKNHNIEVFFNEPELLEILKTKFKNEIVPSLFSILTSAKPTKDLVSSILRIIPENPKVIEPQVQFALASFQYWSTHMTKTFLTSVSQLTNWLILQIESGHEGQSLLASTMVSVLTTWWNQKLTSESFKKDKILLASLFRLSELVAQPCPRDWQPVDSRKKRRILLDNSDGE